MNVFENHIPEDHIDFVEAEAEACQVGHEMWQEITKTQQDTFRKHSHPDDTWQEAVDLLIEIVNRTR